MNQFPAGIHGIVVGVIGDGGVSLRKEHAAFDLHEGGRHHEEFAGDFEVELLHRVQHVDVLARDGLDRDVVDVELALPDQEEKQIERTLEGGQLNAVVGVRNHGRCDAWPPDSVGNEKRARCRSPAQDGAIKTVRIVKRRQQGAADGRGQGPRQDPERFGVRAEGWIPGEELADDGVILRAGEGASGVDQEPARSNKLLVLVQERQLPRRGRRDFSGGGAPLQMR